MSRKKRWVFGMCVLLAGLAIGCGSKEAAVKEEKEAENSNEKDYLYHDAYVIECDTDLQCHDWGPYGVNDILKKYSSADKGEIIFYGASNFARWTTLDEDMGEYRVQNHAFGGSTDVELVGYAPELLFPYEPSVVFFQTGSNDYVQQKGSDEEKIEKCMKYKKAMLADFHEKMPNAEFVIMSGLLLPGRAEYLDMTLEINRQLEAYAQETDYVSFVDANAMTYDGSKFYENLFHEDMIHLNHEGQMLWYREYIKPAIEQVIEEKHLENLRKF